MNRLQLFKTWAPPHSRWSDWAKPSLFAEMPLDALPLDRTPLPVPSLPADPASAVILDLPGPESVRLGLALAGQGYRPVPLFNGAYHLSGIVPNDLTARWLLHGASLLEQLSIPSEAPPVFLLDADRMKGFPRPRTFDNRWMVFPQDFPSARFLLAHGIRQAVWVPAGLSLPADDLAHVLLRWKQAGITLHRWIPGEPPQPIQVRRPSGFKGLVFRALACLGLRRNSAGGFGSYVPEPAASSG